mmetsp:Transcript_25361/g.58818  ORF Transcript_25361/g.58818 Transcript_25361/m.58818 type:complete len:214 (-) Transcript_25361:212-853(-)
MSGTSNFPWSWMSFKSRAGLNAVSASTFTIQECLPAKPSCEARSQARSRTFVFSISRCGFAQPMQDWYPKTAGGPGIGVVCTATPSSPLPSVRGTGFVSYTAQLVHAKTPHFFLNWKMTISSSTFCTTTTKQKIEVRFSQMPCPFGNKDVCAVDGNPTVGSAQVIVVLGGTVVVTFANVATVGVRSSNMLETPNSWVKALAPVVLFASSAPGA